MNDRWARNDRNSSCTETSDNQQPEKLNNPEDSGRSSLIEFRPNEAMAALGKLATITYFRLLRSMIYELEELQVLARQLESRFVRAKTGGRCSRRTTIVESFARDDALKMDAPFAVDRYLVGGIVKLGGMAKLAPVA